MAAGRHNPTFYVVGIKDKIIAPDVQKVFAAEMKAQTTEVAGSHASLVVHASEVAAAIETATLVKRQNRSWLSESGAGISWTGGRPRWGARSG